MPQMAPINWLSLYLIFIFIFFIFIMKNFYMLYYQPKLPMKTSKKKFLNWKW